MTDAAGPLAAALDQHRAGHLHEAERRYRDILKATPQHADALHLLGVVALQEGRYAEAATQIAEAITLAPRVAEFHSNLGAAHERRGDLHAAEASYQHAIELKPDDADFHSNLGNALKAQGRLDAAVRSFERALALQPDHADAWNNLGTALAAQGKVADAIAAYRRALEIREEFPDAHNNLGNALTRWGALDEAIGHHRRALALRPDYAEAHSNLIFALDFDPRVTAREAFEERRRWNTAHARPLAPRIVPHGNDDAPERRLRIGYVSADFNRHSAAVVFAPLILGHDGERFDVVCYSGVQNEDEDTGRFRQAATLWRSTLGMSDDALAEMIRADQIDILVDLAGHSAGNRLRVFAMKPAPIQCTGFGYAAGTGLDAMDYFFADRVTIPPDTRGHYTEEIVELSILVPYDPPAAPPPVMPLPALRRGVCTFGCFNRPAKVTAEVIAAWAEILKALPGSRLLMKFYGLDEPANRRHIGDGFASHRVAPERILFLGGSSRWDHLAAYGEVDLALDPFPHGGGVSALEGLWMGVPMVTLLGERSPGRMGAAFLSALGLDEFVAPSRDEYVRRAVERARDTGGLARIRREIRARLQASPIVDRRAYCGAVEDAYRAMWRRWCVSGSAR